MHTKLYHLAKAVSNHWTTGKISLDLAKMTRSISRSAHAVPLKLNLLRKYNFNPLETYEYNLY